MKTLLLVSLMSLNALAITNQDLLKNQEYNWQKVIKKDQVKHLSVTGQVIAEEGALHFQSARVSGRVLSLLNEEGSSVKKGMPLFKITGPECVSLREERRIAQKANLEDLVSSIDQRQGELNIQVTEKDCFIISDADGVLVKRTAGSGNSFSYGDSLAQVLEASNMKIEIEVPEKSAALVSKGSIVSFSIPSLNGFKGQSQVHQVFPIVEEGSRIMKARLQKIPLPKGTKLNSLVFAEIHLPTGKTCFSVPTTAVTLQDNSAWILKKGETLMSIPVNVLGAEKEEMLVMPSDQTLIREGDTIATFNVPFLYQQFKKNSSKSTAK